MGSAQKWCKNCNTPIVTSGGKDHWEHVLTPGKLCPTGLVVAFLRLAGMAQGKGFTAEPR